jgi:hypothetical protein
VYGAVADARGRAGHFKGPVLVDGDLTVTGVKGAVVSHPDGSHRLFCAIESPESWFEDFGEATLHDGEAEIPLDPDFAQLTSTDRYHVFLTAYGDSRGLYVERRTPRSFTVREQQEGKSRLPFSYRVVAKRRDIEVPRFKKVHAPEAILDDVLEKERVGERGAASEMQPDHEDFTVAKPRSEAIMSRPVRSSIENPGRDKRNTRR